MTDEISVLYKLIKCQMKIHVAFERINEMFTLELKALDFGALLVEAFHG